MHLAWEYQAFRISGGGGNGLVDGMNRVGADGWEVVFVEHHADHELVYCKRCKTAITLPAALPSGAFPFSKAGRRA